MKYIVAFKHYGLDLNVKENATDSELCEAYLEALGGPQNAYNHFMRHLIFIEDTIKDIDVE